MRLVMVAVLAGCASEGPRPQWDPPEPAAATCTYHFATRTSNHGPLDEYFAESTLYYDERGHVVRVDGFGRVDGKYSRVTHRFGYDAVDRLVSVLRSDVLERIEYGANQIVRSGPEVWTIDVVDQLPTVYQGPLVLPEAERDTYRFEHDSARRITRIESAVRTYPSQSDGVEIQRRDVRYRYDAAGRVVYAEGPSSGPLAFTFTETTHEQVVETSGGIDGTGRFVVGYDDDRRVVRIAYQRHANTNTEIIEYNYAPGVIEERRTEWMTTAIGTCPAISVTFAPDPLLPLVWSATHVRQWTRHTPVEWLTDPPPAQPSPVVDKGL